MLRLVSEDEEPVAPDTDFDFLADSEDVSVGGLRTVLQDVRTFGVDRG